MKNYHYVVRWEEPMNINTCQRLKCTQNNVSRFCIVMFVGNLVRRNCSNIELQVVKDE